MVTYEPTLLCHYERASVTASRSASVTTAPEFLPE